MKVVTAGILKRKKDGTILLVRRGTDESLSGCWEFPGGKVESGETEEACLKRELFEELDINVQVGSFVAESHYVYDHGEFLIRAYEVEFIEQTISLTVHDALSWVSSEELKTYRLAPADIPIAEALSDN